ncbi:MAG: hypothetical protein IH628_03255, partial [Proteobacteria bacterium]|nr:hypothetical protein [Pseudomonadota bacterium]
WRLRGWQKLSYLLSGTYYFGGIPMLINLILPILFLFFGVWAVEMPFRGYVTHLIPFVTMFLAIHLLAQRWMRHPSERGLQWRGMLLKLGTWPVYVLALVFALSRRDVPYLPTPKVRRGGGNPLLVLPHAAVVLLSLAAIAWGLNSPLADFEGTRLMVFFASLNSLLMLPTIGVAAVEALRGGREVK